MAQEGTLTYSFCEMMPVSKYVVLNLKFDLVLRFVHWGMNLYSLSEKYICPRLTGLVNIILRHGIRQCPLSRFQITDNFQR